MVCGISASPLEPGFDPKLKFMFSRFLPLSKSKPIRGHIIKLSQDVSKSLNVPMFVWMTPRNELMSIPGHIPHVSLAFLGWALEPDCDQDDVLTKDG